jgi:hypothetical protein
VKDSKLEWYFHRLQMMSAHELIWRISDFTRQQRWRRHQVAPGSQEPSSRWGRLRPATVEDPPQFTATLATGALSTVPATARDEVTAVADEVLSGDWAVLGVLRLDLEDPDWFLDPVSGIRAPQAVYCFRTDHRDTRVTGNVKQVWELSRHHHVTVLAAAYALTRNEEYAERAAQHLCSWWRENPFLSGVHWTSGIEVGLRLIAWVWTRRLLEGWKGVSALFEDNDAALQQIWWHQRYLAAFRSRGSSANNHVIAEAAGQLIAALAFPWFRESDSWRVGAASLLEAELKRNTFRSGVNRELAFDYHGFVAELAVLAAVEADHAGRPLSDRTWQILGTMLDVVASVVDVRLRAPRQGDSDDGKALLLASPESNRWASLLSLGGILFGTPDWWPLSEPDAFSTLVASMGRQHQRPGYRSRRPSHFGDAGLTIMRSAPGDGKEIWCRCDGGPHGFLSIAAHAHADALSVEVRHDGIDILADPGTYCYNSEPRWRSYFKSTLGHNTVELGRRNQSESGGPTLWVRHAQTQLLEVRSDEDGRIGHWSAEHHGYAALDPPARHRRTVELSSANRTIEILDEVRSGGGHQIRVVFHLGPEVRAALKSFEVDLSWKSEDESIAAATLYLPSALRWSLVQASDDPVLGWYSGSFGQKEPCITVLGEGETTGSDILRSALQFADHPTRSD